MKRAPLHFHIISLFPDSMRAYLSDSIIGRAQRDKMIKVSYYNPRDFTKDRWRRVDRRPYAGGPGMVLEAEPILKAAEAAVRVSRKRSPLKGKSGQAHTAICRSPCTALFLSPAGKQFDSAYAKNLAAGKRDILIIAGHYEGVDARVAKILKAKEISMGPYVLTGGEVPAMAIVDAVARFVPGVLGKHESLEDERVSSSEVYTRPEVLTWKGKKYRVPKVLLSGHHKKIEEWKKRKR